MESEQFGQFIRQCRHDLCISQAELAEKLHVTSKAVSRWERGVGFPDIKLLQPLADALEITIVELMQSKRIEADIPKEEAADLVSGTVDTLRQQEKLSRNRYAVTFCGSISIFLASMLVVWVSLIYPFQPKWVEFVLHQTGIAGGILGARALQRVPLPVRWCRSWRCIVLCGGSLFVAGLLFYAIYLLTPDLQRIRTVFLPVMALLAGAGSTFSAKYYVKTSGISFSD